MPGLQTNQANAQWRVAQLLLSYQQSPEQNVCLLVCCVWTTPTIYMTSLGILWVLPVYNSVFIHSLDLFITLCQISAFLLLLDHRLVQVAGCAMVQQT
jgi:hypothetical protein